MTTKYVGVGIGGGDSDSDDQVIQSISQILIHKIVPKEDQHY